MNTFCKKQLSSPKTILYSVITLFFFLSIWQGIVSFGHSRVYSVLVSKGHYALPNNIIDYVYTHHDQFYHPIKYEGYQTKTSEELCSQNIITSTKMYHVALTKNSYIENTWKRPITHTNIVEAKWLANMINYTSWAIILPNTTAVGPKTSEELHSKSEARRMDEQTEKPYATILLYVEHKNNHYVLVYFNFKPLKNFETAKLSVCICSKCILFWKNMWTNCLVFLSIYTKFKMEAEFIITYPSQF